ncbi:hypothetical protein ABIB94_004079 [Bradyrhizobium sp. JR7.2]|jgi:hypothetical protein|uniref:Conjugative transfer region protein TrbK n=4 Tax=Bradyrhizobium TaxID=374 RepID=A0A850J5M3_9BRAD|nr:MULTISPECIES: hypothetical protein [Bradyrhizobium]OSJ31496.1 hypothetical protein BSZ19_21625 [Bradyrhizobium japonicum]UEM09622.1 hypothetical protein J4G43_033630 [Bradyrhizobium barranii subsp. barranii]UFW84044.1 hypothetical protein BjapCC829_29370 [Bradyrhizobium japonicum]UPT84939.1 hypothetical protein HAP41_0000032025 [Bradyrhizobium barranii subsp. apii]UPU00180.1 hypothetical protein J4G48_0020050 [Bradyrhizobium barranii subsp. apii]
MVLRTALVVTALAGITFAARAEDRSVLLNCKAMVERASKDTGTATEAELTRCRQIMREWALRDARTTVDEQGRPLK